MRYDVIDLGPVIPTGFIILSYFNPELKIRLPNEKCDVRCDVQFYLPSQIDSILRPADAVLNVTSFQEMDLESVEDYFGFIAECLGPDEILFCVNRLKKETEFHQFPWPKTGYTTVTDREDLTSRFSGDEIIVWRRIIRRNSGVSVD